MVVQTLVISFTSGVLAILFVLFLKKKWGFFGTTFEVVAEYKDKDFFKLIRSLLKPHHDIVYNPKIGNLIDTGFTSCTNSMDMVSAITSDTVDMLIFDNKTGKIIRVIYLKPEDSQRSKFEKTKESILTGLFEEAGHPFVALCRVNDFDAEKIKGILYPEYSVDINEEGLEELINDVYNKKEKE